MKENKANARRPRYPWNDRIWFRVLPITLQMKGRWESNINFWFPFPRNETVIPKNRIIMFRLPVPTLINLWEIYMYISKDWSAYSAAGKYVGQSWEYINSSQTHECGNWDWGRAIPRKGIHKWDFLWRGRYNDFDFFLTKNEASQTRYKSKMGF
jgi:hypothetical protein